MELTKSSTDLEKSRVLSAGDFGGVCGKSGDLKNC